MNRNCVDGLVVKLRLSRFGGLLGAAASAGIVSEVVQYWLGFGKRGKWCIVSHWTRCGAALKFGCEAGHGLVSDGARRWGAACGGRGGEDGYGRLQPSGIARAVVEK